MNDSDEMKRILGGVAEVHIPAPVDSAAMVTSFESMARDQLRASRQRLPLYLALTSGTWLLTGALCLNSGKENLKFFGWTMLIGAPLFAVLFLALWHTEGTMIKDQDLLRRMDEDRELGSSKPVVIRGILISLVLFGVLGAGIAKASGLLGLGILVMCYLLCAYVYSIVSRRNRRQHQELWDWWDGRHR